MSDEQQVADGKIDIAEIARLVQEAGTFADSAEYPLSLATPEGAAAARENVDLQRAMRRKLQSTMQVMNKIIDMTLRTERKLEDGMKKARRAGRLAA